MILRTIHPRNYSEIEEWLIMNVGEHGIAWKWERFYASAHWHVNINFDDEELAIMFKLKFGI
jgi:hypothetical protein